MALVEAMGEAGTVAGSAGAFGRDNMRPDRVLWRPEHGGGSTVPVAMPVQTDWLKSVLFDRGYLARIKGEAIKVYLVMVRLAAASPTGVSA